MGITLVIPGTLGVELANPTDTGPSFWADKDQLLRFGISPMELQGDLAGSTAQSATSLTPIRPLKDYYDSGIKTLIRDLAGTPWESVVSWNYDWRKAHIPLGHALAEWIKGFATADNKVMLIGHSLGGIIARLAYYELKQQGLDNLVARMITLGAPNLGSMRVVDAWMGGTKEGYGFAMIEGWRKGLFAFPPDLNNLMGIAVRVMMSWPSFYDFLPTPLNDGTARDEVVKQFYTEDFYRTNGVTKGWKWYQPLANNALSATNPRLAHPDSIPQGRKLVCVVSSGWPTRDAIGSGRAAKGATAILGEITEGDGTCTVQSATIKDSQIVEVTHPHDRLFKSLAESGELAYYVKENFLPKVMVPIAPVKVDLPPANDTIRQMPIRDADIPPRKFIGNKRR